MSGLSLILDIFQIHKPCSFLQRQNTILVYMAVSYLSIERYQNYVLVFFVSDR